MNFILVVMLSFFAFFCKVDGGDKTREERLAEESEAILKRGLKLAELFYTLGNGEDLREITGDLLNSSETGQKIKEQIINTGRRFFLFAYPSDGFLVKGYISFGAESEENPLLLFLRGGNRHFGLFNPANSFSCMKNYTVMGTAYRGGISAGLDEFGGSDVNDVQNLLDYLPVLEQKLGQSFRPKNIYMIGGSRGAMEMFLALGRSPSLQERVTKAVSLSGLLDMRECVRDREDMRKMFIEDFGLIPGVNEEEWINRRDPIKAVDNIRKDLPILILQGAGDMRVNLKEGLHMVEKLKNNGNAVEYLEFTDGDHFLSNQPNLIELITDWLEKN